MLDWLFGKYNVYYRMVGSGMIFHRRFRNPNHARAFCSICARAKIVELGETYAH